MRTKIKTTNGTRLLLREVIAEVARRHPEIVKRADLDMELVDSRQDLTLFPTQEDYANAVRKDVCRCVFANASDRQTGAIASVFFQTTAYIAHLGKDGVRRWHRYLVPTRLHRTIVAYDERGVKPDLNIPFELKAVRETATLKAKKAGFDTWKESDMGKALAMRRTLISKTRQLAADVDRTKSRVTTLRDRYGDSSPAVVSAKKQLATLKTNLSATRDTLGDLESKIDHLRENSDYRGTGVPKPRTYGHGIRSGVKSLHKAIELMRAEVPRKKAA